MSCNICLDFLFTKDSVVYIARCGHMHHYSCWESCLNRPEAGPEAKLCPYCRKPTSLQDLVRVYLSGDNDDLLTSATKRIDTLNLEVSALKEQKRAAEEMVTFEQAVSSSLRDDQKKYENEAENARKALQSLQQQLDQEKNGRKGSIALKKQMEVLLKSVKHSNNKKEDLRQILCVSKREADKLRSQIGSLETREETAGPEIEALSNSRRALDALDEKIDDLNQRLELKQ